MNDEIRFQETCLPCKDAFCSKIKKSHISNKDYNHDCNVFQRLNISILGEHSDLYLKTYVLLLTDIFENFRNIALRDYKLDLCHFYSASGLSWAAMLQMTKVNLDLIKDIDDLLLWERACRGGVSQISSRYSQAKIRIWTITIPILSMHISCLSMPITSVSLRLGVSTTITYRRIPTPLQRKNCKV